MDATARRRVLILSLLISSTSFPSHFLFFVLSVLHAFARSLPCGFPFVRGRWTPGILFVSARQHDAIPILPLPALPAPGLPCTLEAWEYSIPRYHPPFHRVCIPSPYVHRYTWSFLCLCQAWRRVSQNHHLISYSYSESGL